MFEAVRHQGENSPPVAGRAGRRPRFFDRVAVLKQELVDLIYKRIRIGFGHLCQSGIARSLKIAFAICKINLQYIQVVYVG